MTNNHKARGLATGRGWRILRMLMVRGLVYAGLCAIVVLALMDFGSPPAHAPAGRVEKIIGEDGAGWPHLLGPSYNGHSGETGIAESWPVKGPPVLWSREVGAGYSGMSARGGVVYTQGQSATAQKLLALDADTGQTIWEHQYGWAYDAAGMFPGPRATPTVVGERVYFCAPNGLVGCVNREDGKPVWSVNVIEKFKGRGAAFGYSCSPVVEEGKVILPVGGEGASMVALDAATGATVWGSGSSPASYCSALPISFKGRRQVVTFMQNALAGFDLSTGKLLWERGLDRGHDEHAATPLYQEPYLRAQQAYRGGSDLYELTAAAEKEGGVEGVEIKRVKHDASLSNDVASSVLVEGFVYGFDLKEMQASPRRPARGTFRCLDFKTGEVKWSSDKPGQASILVAEGKLLMLNDSGELLLVRANPNRYEELARAEIFTGETCWTAPALDRGRLYLRSPTRAACVFVGRPETMTARQQKLAMPAGAMPKTGPRNITWLMGGEREFPFEMPDAKELKRWFWYSLGAIGLAALLAGAVHGIIRLARVRWMQGPAAMVFWSGLIVLGIAGTPLANRYASGFVFLWPVALLAVHQLALAGVARSKEAPDSRAAHGLGIAGAGLLVLGAVLYFKLTRQLSLAPAWYFLLAFPIAWVLAVPAARRMFRTGLIREVMWMAVVFAVYFWGAGAIMLLRTAWG